MVGIGGTGSLVVDGLCRLLNDIDIPLVIIDYDRVEPPNLLRQAFFKEDLGKFKSQVIAERCARQYGRRIYYSIYPFDKELSLSSGKYMITPLAQNSLIIGCVDNPLARQSIAETLDKSFGNWWLDTGNGYNFGQVLIGNTNSIGMLAGAFHKNTQEAYFIPSPALQRPELLAQTDKQKQPECAEAIRDDEQSPVINQAMSVLVLEFVRRMLYDNLDWIGAYLDLQTGTLKTVPAEPATIAHMMSLESRYLMYKEEKRR